MAHLSYQRQEREALPREDGKQSGSKFTYTFLNPPTIPGPSEMPGGERHFLLCSVAENTWGFRTSDNGKFTISRNVNKIRKPSRKEGESSLRLRGRRARTAVFCQAEKYRKKIKPEQLLFPTHPAPRMALVRMLPGSWLPWWFFFLDNSLPQQARCQLK